MKRVFSLESRDTKTYINFFCVCVTHSAGFLQVSFLYEHPEMVEYSIRKESLG